MQLEKLLVTHHFISVVEITDTVRVSLMRTYILDLAQKLVKSNKISKALNLISQSNLIFIDLTVKSKDKLQRAICDTPLTEGIHYWEINCPIRLEGICKK